MDFSLREVSSSLFIYDRGDKKWYVQGREELRGTRCVMIDDHNVNDVKNMKLSLLPVGRCDVVPHVR